MLTALAMSLLLAGTTARSQRTADVRRSCPTQGVEATVCHDAKLTTLAQRADREYSFALSVADPFQRNALRQAMSQFLDWRVGLCTDKKGFGSVGFKPCLIDYYKLKISELKSFSNANLHGARSPAEPMPSRYKLLRSWTGPHSSRILDGPLTGREALIEIDMDSSDEKLCHAMLKEIDHHKKGQDHVLPGELAARQWSPGPGLVDPTPFKGKVNDTQEVAGIAHDGVKALLLRSPDGDTQRGFYYWSSADGSLASESLAIIENYFAEGLIEAFDFGGKTYIGGWRRDIPNYIMGSKRFYNQTANVWVFSIANLADPGDTLCVFEPD